MKSVTKLGVQSLFSKLLGMNSNDTRGRQVETTRVSQLPVLLVAEVILLHDKRPVVGVVNNATSNFLSVVGINTIMHDSLQTVKDILKGHDTGILGVLRI